MPQTEYTPNLSENEKVLVMRSIFQSGKKEKSDNYIKNAGDFISGNFEKIDGFDFRWTSLITNNPLLFEDVDYLRIKNFIENRITEKEKEAYVNGELRELYATFDNMLMCNLRYYDRIISYCTMVFLHYIRIGDEITSQYLDKIPYEISMTPTKIWCAAMSGINSTCWELNYGWNTRINDNSKFLPKDTSLLEAHWKTLYKNITFAKFTEYCAFRNGSKGFRHTFAVDITNNRKLSQVCAKFTKTSIAISEQQLETIYTYAKECDTMKNRLYASLDKCLNVLFEGDTKQYAIYIFEKEFYIYSSKFSMKVNSENGTITKDYLANSYECFAAEEFFVPSIKMQIEWAKYKLEPHFEYDKNILKSILTNMLETDYKNIICIKRMNEYGIVAKASFSGCWANVKITEEYMLDNRCIRSQTKILSKKNAAIWIIEKGYYIFGTIADVFKLDHFSREDIINHYKNYCIPIINHMFDIISLHEMSKNDIIDVVVSGNLNPSKLNNHNIKYANTYNSNSKNLFNSGLDKQNKRNLGSKKSYWKAIE